jgi:release factor glutamine methyltransferase
MDILKDIPDGPFDLLVSNPPYIPEKEMRETMSEVHQYEPKIALTDERDGLTFYRRFAKIGKSLIKPGGSMVLEVGLGEHPSKAVDIFQSAGYTQLELIPDYNSDERVLKIQI